MVETAVTVHASLLPCEPVPSLTHAPLVTMWQYWAPERIVQKVLVGIGGGGDGEGGGGDPIATGVVVAQMTQPP